MKFKQTLSKILTNKYVLQAVFILCVFNLFGYIIYGSVESVFYFIIIALIVSYFSQNMIIILSIPLLLVNMLSLGKYSTSTNSKKSVEGMENNNSEEDNNNSVDTMIKKVKNQNAKSSNTPITPLHDNSVSNTEESFEVGRKYTNNPIDYQSTIEDAYSDLNKIIGGDGIKKLTSDTQGLMKQQLQLAEAMKNMGPLIQGMAPLLKQAEGLLGGMGEGGVNNIAALAKKFSS